MADDRESGRRYRADLQGVLQFATDVSDGTEVNSGQPMSDDRRQFLNSALDSMTVDIISEQKKLLTLLQDPDSDDVTRVSCLQQLHDLCDDINVACDFHKIGGFPVLEKHLRHDDGEVRWSAAELLAGLVQNNPYCQAAATNVRLMKQLMRMLDSDQVDTVRVKALYALSCLCRDCIEAQEEFCRLDGFSHLMRAMQYNNDKLQVKSAFMLSSLCTAQPKFKDTLCDMGMVEQLIGLLRSPHSAFHEHVMSALVTIVDGHSRAVSVCQQSELEFRPFLIDRIREIDGKAEFEEEKSYALRLMEVCFNRPDSSGLER